MLRNLSPLSNKVDSKCLPRKPTTIFHSSSDRSARAAELTKVRTKFFSTRTSAIALSFATGCILSIRSPVIVNGASGWIRWIVSRAVCHSSSGTVVDFRGLVEVASVFTSYVRAPATFFPGHDTGSCTGRSCGTTVKHHRGTRGLRGRRSSDARSRRIRNRGGEICSRCTVLNR